MKTIKRICIVFALTGILPLFMSAQTESNKTTNSSLHQNELQVEMGESLGLLHLFDIIDNDFSPTISLSYHNRVLKRLWIGASLGYNQDGDYTSYVESINGNVILENFTRIHRLSFVPSIKFSYFDKKNLTMYLGGQAGMCWLSYSNPKSNFGEVNELGLFLQLTAFGINYGKNFYIGGEIGFGHKGLFNFTAGYRF
jgi:hypothetical protein